MSFRLAWLYIMNACSGSIDEAAIDVSIESRNRRLGIQRFESGKSGRTQISKNC